MILFESGDVIVVPFPFVDSALAKKRPAVVLSSTQFQKENHAVICCMITSLPAVAEWRGDVVLKSWQKAGLKKACLVRFKVFTLNDALISGKIGRIQPSDWKKIQDNWAEI
jgi:mRNA interferase MazF